MYSLDLPSAEQRGPCSISHDGQTTTLKYGVQSSVNGKQLTHECEITFDVGATRGDAKSVKITSTTTVKLGDDPLLRIERDTQGGSTQVKYSYGQAFEGIKEVAFTTDGKTVHGTVDNRSIVPHPAGADPSTIKYADGKPAPGVKLDSAVGTALTALLKKAHDTVSTCKNAGAAVRLTAPIVGFNFSPGAGVRASPAPVPPLKSPVSHPQPLPLLPQRLARWSLLPFPKASEKASDRSADLVAQNAKMIA